MKLKFGGMIKSLVERFAKAKHKFQPQKKLFYRVKQQYFIVREIHGNHFAVSIENN